MTHLADKPDTPVEKLLWVMERLRDPNGGCPWDIEQTFATIVPHTIEEAYEVADAIEQQDWSAIPDEIGDLLFQVVFYAQMAKEEDRFDFHAIADGIAEKMIRRHPHVFGDGDKIDSADQQVSAWEALKAQERTGKGEQESRKSALDGVALALPALTRAYKLQKRAARVGFDWNDANGALDKIREETDEVLDEMNAGADAARLEDEMGDLLFSAVNLARKLGVDPEQALRRGSAKFETRFRAMEEALDQDGTTVADTPLDDLDKRWNAVKAAE